MKRYSKYFAFILMLAFLQAAQSGWNPVFSQSVNSFELARAKYRGGGDWYNDPSSLTNLIQFAKDQLPLPVKTNYTDVSVGSPEIFDYPFIFLTGHGNITLNQAEAENLRTYLDNGGFLFIDDDYGLDEYMVPALKEVFPNEELLEIPYDHPIYHQVYSFPQGLPKIHEHDNKPPRGYGLFRDGRLVIFYTVESNLADGWADPEIHNDPPEVRRKALQMGTNILVYALTRF